MGATIVVDPREEPAVEAWQNKGGAGPLVIFEAVGVPGMIDDAMLSAPRDTHIVVVGVCMVPDTIRPMRGITRELSMQFALGYDPLEFADTLRHIAEGEIDVSPLITGSVDIAGIPGAFTDLANPEAHAKILVEPPRPGIRAPVESGSLAPHPPGEPERPVPTARRRSRARPRAVERTARPRRSRSTRRPRSHALPVSGRSGA